MSTGVPRVVDALELQMLIKAAFVDVPFPEGEIELEHPIYTVFLRPVWHGAPSLVPEPMDKKYMDSHDVFLLHADLAMCSPKQVQYILPRLMIAQLRNYPRDMIYVPDIVSFLNVPSVLSPQESTILSPHLIENFTVHRQLFASLKQSKFTLFDKKQVKTIIMWLMFVRNWFSEEDEFDIDRIFQIDAAAKYWSDIMQVM